MKRMLHPALQKLAALIVLGVGLGAAIAALAYPLEEALAARAEAQARLARYATLAKDAPPAAKAYDPATLVAVHTEAAEAQLALQATVDRLARAANINLQSVQPMAAEHLGGIGQGAWLEVTAACDLETLLAFLKAFEAERPLLFIRRLDIEPGQGLRPDMFLTAKLHVGRVWRSAGGPA